MSTPDLLATDNQTVPGKISSTDDLLNDPAWKEIKNLAYTDDERNERQKLDLYLPSAPAQRTPLIIYIHGGGWFEGDKNEVKALPLLRHGYAVASINYRLTDTAHYPAQVHDCKAAVRWLRAHADQYNIDPDRIGAWGESAGAYLAALLGTSGGIKQLEGNLGSNNQSSAVQAVVDWYGPTDFLDAEKMKSLSGIAKQAVIAFLGTESDNGLEIARSASPITYVNKNNPPFLIMHGNCDQLVPLDQSLSLNRALQKAGVQSQLVIVNGAGHDAFEPAQTKLVYEFFNAHLK